MDAAAELAETGESLLKRDEVPARTEVVTNPAGWTGAKGAPSRLLLLRHGQTELSAQRRYSGRGNPALTDLGRRQVAAAARYLGQQGGIDAVVSSPLQR